MGAIANVRAGDSVQRRRSRRVDAQAVPQLAENFNGTVTLAANVPAGRLGIRLAGPPQNASGRDRRPSALQLLNAANGYTVTRLEPAA